MERNEHERKDMIFKRAALVEKALAEENIDDYNLFISIVYFLKRYEIKKSDAIADDNFKPLYNFLRRYKLHLDLRVSGVTSFLDTLE